MLQTIGRSSEEETNELDVSLAILSVSVFSSGMWSPHFCGIPSLALRLEKI